MGYWEYTQSFGRKSAKKAIVGCQKNLVHRKTPYIVRLIHLGIIQQLRSVPHQLTPQQAQRIVDICRQFIGNPMDDRFIRRIVTCDEKWVYYCNTDASKQWLDPLQPAKVIVKKNVLPQSNVVCLVEFWRCYSLEDCSKRAWNRCGSLFSTIGASSWNFETDIPRIS